MLVDENKVQKVKDKIQNTLFDKRIILLYDGIDYDTAKEIVENLLVLDSINHDPITLRINSPGGEIAAGFDIISAMSQVKSPIHTYISGEACSMAALISVCGDKRFITSNSCWMSHPGAGGDGEDYFQFKKDRAKYYDLLDKESEKILKKYTKLTKLEIDKQNHGELWLNASACKKKGIVDVIKKI